MGYPLTMASAYRLGISLAWHQPTEGVSPIHVTPTSLPSCTTWAVSPDVTIFHTFILLLFVVSHVVVKKSFTANTESSFCSPKPGEGESKLLQGSIRKSTAHKTKWEIKIFHEWQSNTWRLWRFVQSLVMEYRFGKYGCQHLKLLAEQICPGGCELWSEGVSSKDPLWNYLWHPKAFGRNCRKRSIKSFRCFG